MNPNQNVQESTAAKMQAGTAHSGALGNLFINSVTKRLNYIDPTGAIFHAEKEVATNVIVFVAGE